MPNATGALGDPRDVAGDDVAAFDRAGAIRQIDGCDRSKAQHFANRCFGICKTRHGGDHGAIMLNTRGGAYGEEASPYASNLTSPIPKVSCRA